MTDDGAELEILRLGRRDLLDAEGRHVPAGELGNQRMVGRVTTPTASIEVKKYLVVNPVRILGTEAEGQAGTLTVDTSVSQPVYLVGPGKPAQGDDLICERLTHRWVARKKGGGGRFLITDRDGCSLVARPGVTVTVKNASNVTVATGVTNFLGQYLTPELPSSGNPYTITAPGYTSGSLTWEEATATASIVTGTTPVELLHLSENTAYFRLRINNPCPVGFSDRERLPGATVRITGPNGFDETRVTDSLGMAEFPEIHRTFQERGAAFDLLVTHPDFATFDFPGYLNMACETIGPQNETLTMNGNEDRFYSGRLSAGNACWNRPMPAQVSITILFDGSDPVMTNASGTVVANLTSLGGTWFYASAPVDLGTGYTAVYNFGLVGDCNFATPQAGVGVDFHNSFGLDTSYGTSAMTGTTCPGPTFSYSGAGTGIISASATSL